jgi:hypothetical protein
MTSIGSRRVACKEGDCVANFNTSNHVRVRKFSEHLAVTETYFFFLKGSVFSTAFGSSH